MSRPPFQPFDEHRALQIYQRSLPHWRQDSATYFVTFRLGDAIPRAVARAWDEDRRRWRAAQSNRRGTDFSPSNIDIDAALSQLAPDVVFQYHKHFNRKMQEYLDRGIGKCHLRNVHCVSIVRDEIIAGDGESYHSGDFVIMPNHVHWLVVPRPRQELKDVLKRIKGASSRNCNLVLLREGQFWQPESYDHIVRSLEQLLAYREYIAANPKCAGITVPPEAVYRADWMDAWFRAGE